MISQDGDTKSEEIWSVCVRAIHSQIASHVVILCVWSVHVRCRSLCHSWRLKFAVNCSGSFTCCDPICVISTCTISFFVSQLTFAVNCSRNRTVRSFLQTQQWSLSSSHYTHCCERRLIECQCVECHSLRIWAGWRHYIIVSPCKTVHVAARAQANAIVTPCLTQQRYYQQSGRVRLLGWAPKIASVQCLHVCSEY